MVLQDHGKCPVTKEDLTLDDIVPVKTNKVRLLWYAYKLLKQHFPVAYVVYYGLWGITVAKLWL